MLCYESFQLWLSPCVVLDMLKVHMGRRMLRHIQPLVTLYIINISFTFLIHITYTMQVYCYSSQIIFIHVYTAQMH